MSLLKHNYSQWAEKNHGHKKENRQWAGALGYEVSEQSTSSANTKLADQFSIILKEYLTLTKCISD